MARTAPRSHVAAALPALCEAIELWPEDDPAGRRRAESLRDHLRAATMEGLPIRERAERLGVSVSTLQRWQAAGVL